MPDAHGMQPVVAAVAPEEAGELLTLQRAAYATEAQIYSDPYLPALTQTLDELRAELDQVTALKATAGHRRRPLPRPRRSPRGEGVRRAPAEDRDKIMRRRC